MDSGKLKTTGKNYSWVYRSGPSELPTVRRTFAQSQWANHTITERNRPSTKSIGKSTDRCLRAKSPNVSGKVDLERNLTPRNSRIISKQGSKSTPNTNRAEQQLGTFFKTPRLSPINKQKARTNKKSEIRRSGQSILDTTATTEKPVDVSLKKCLKAWEATFLKSAVKNRRKASRLKLVEKKIQDKNTTISQNKLAINGNHLSDTSKKQLTPVIIIKNRILDRFNDVSPETVHNQIHKQSTNLPSRDDINIDTRNEKHAKTDNFTTDFTLKKSQKDSMAARNKVVNATFIIKQNSVPVDKSTWTKNKHFSNRNKPKLTTKLSDQLKHSTSDYSELREEGILHNDSLVGLSSLELMARQYRNEIVFTEMRKKAAVSLRSRNQTVD